MKKIILLILVSAIFLSGCVMNKLDNKHRRIDLDLTLEQGLAIDVTAGETWSSRMQAGPFIFNVLPQAAVWIENDKGELIKTLYVTGADFKKIKHAEKNKDGALFFSECLPLWTSKLEAAGDTLPSKQNPYPDTITSATPPADFTLHTSIEGKTDTVFLFVELNKSNDNNSVYTKDNNSWAGQPSLIYSAAVNGMSKKVKLTLAGHGGKIGEGRGINPDLTGFDSALDQIEEITVSIK